MQIPAAVGFVFQGLVLFYLLGAELLVNYKIVFRKVNYPDTKLKLILLSFIITILLFIVYFGIRTFTFFDGF